MDPAVLSFFPQTMRYYKEHYHQDTIKQSFHSAGESSCSLVVPEIRYTPEKSDENVLTAR
jgi:hypothetical protein